MTRRSWIEPSRASETALDVYVGEGQDATGHVVAEHIAGLVQKRLTRLAQTKNFEVAKDAVEALHDLRVASRRLRAFVDVFEPLLNQDIARRAKRPLRKVTRAVRTLRDWDVQAGLLGERLARATTEIGKITLEDLLASVAAQRKQEAKLAHRRLRAVDFDDVHFSVCAALGATVTRLPAPGSASRQLLWELLEPFVRATSANHPPDDGLEHPEWMHDFRIRLKKLRYALELFEPTLGAAFEPLYAPVEALQELLGQHHDLVVLAELVERHRRALEQQGRGTLARNLVSLQEQLTEERQTLAVRFRHADFDPESWRQTLLNQLEIGAGA
jgi:CHAD domain-containing protein